MLRLVQAKDREPWDSPSVILTVPTRHSAMPKEPVP